MENTAVVEPQANQESPIDQAPIAPADPFALDENALTSLSPEQRASLDPIMDSWKKKAVEEIQKRESDASQKYKPYEEKAQTLDKLTNYAPFVQWWQAQQRTAAAGASPAQQGAVSQSKPQDFATQQEWQEAIWQASQGDAAKLQEINSKMMAAWATPFVQQLNQRQQVIETQLEVKDLFERHPDAKDLDAIGLDPKTKEGTSLLEMALDWSERNQKSLEDGYQLAKKWADSMRVGAQQQAMGLVNGKRNDITAGPSTSNSSQNIIEVSDSDELLRKSMEAQLAGQKDVRFVIRKK
ncbi:MAG TPA: hypothetical protein VF974_08210 [Patescibacteria group bacterium]